MGEEMNNVKFSIIVDGKESDVKPVFEKVTLEPVKTTQLEVSFVVTKSGFHNVVFQTIRENLV